MRVIGILGGVASGKSLVSDRLAQLGAGLIDADKVGHEVLLLPEVIFAARDRWGFAVLTEGGQIDRPRLAKEVFGSTPMAVEALRFWESVTHPLIGHLICQKIESYRDQSFEAVVLDAPVMIEAGWDSVCEILIFVDSPREVRLQRATTRGWSKEDFAAREAVQKSLDFKLSQADFVIDNSGLPETVLDQVDRFWQNLVGS
jgi:dephospho-CoA kinase